MGREGCHLGGKIMGQQLTVGRIVQYKLTDEDAKAINKRRGDWAEFQKSKAAYEGTELRPTESGHQAHVGNVTKAGDVLPMIVTAVHSSDLVNGKVFLDGNDSLWVTSRKLGAEDGQWAWPPRQEAPKPPAEESDEAEEE